MSDLSLPAAGPASRARMLSPVRRPAAPQGPTELWWRRSAAGVDFKIKMEEPTMTRSKRRTTPPLVSDDVRRPVGS
ncbi:hypothetical protein HPP92_024797 [Vanilla planifolia]|uniref:Uncharacterized protein n=1 Tax=Vanilla planifolia TaxID=51239 RepID=A0A835PGR5_VANPL|nr:hypothetical protein HPP92_025017 [Vanilla planifolia]KAG0453493.1 hypothetical protein HPP92_024797 [Vanilla planifolia]